MTDSISACAASLLEISPTRDKSPAAAPPPRVSSTKMIYEAVCDLHALEQLATRETVAELTGLKLTVVDDRLAVLVDDGKLQRVLRGVYIPIETFPPARAISKTILTDGRVKYEVGDDVLTLTPKEDRALSNLTAGAATQAIAIESSRAMAIRATEFGFILERLERVTRVVDQGAQPPGPDPVDPA